MDPVEKVCVEQLEATIQHMDVSDKQNTFLACIRLMAIAETFNTIPGPRRKELVMETIKKHMPETSSTDMPNFIDVAVGMDKGKLNISMPTDDPQGCLSSILGKCFATQK